MSPVLVPTSYIIPALGGTAANPSGQATPVAAGGGSIVNTGTVSLNFATTASPQPPNVITIAPGGSIPWPANQPCWCWAAAGNVAGSCSVVPLPLTFNPGPGATEAVLYTGKASDTSVPINITQVNVGYLKIVRPAELNVPVTTGVQSGLKYPAYEPPTAIVGAEQIWLIPIDPAVDQSYTITWAGSAGEPYIVLAVYGTAYTLVYDTALAGLLVEDGTGATTAFGIPLDGYNRAGDAYRAINVDSKGDQFVVPVAPNNTSNDHPPNELIQVSNFWTTGTLIGAPGVGLRYRVFEICLVCGGNFGADYAEIDWTIFTGAAQRMSIGQIPGAPLSNQGTLQLSFRPSGIALATNGAITGEATTTSWYSILLTIETV